MMNYPAEAIEYTYARMGNEAMLKAMLYAGQHFHVVADARRYAEGLGYDPKLVKAGIGA